MYLISHQQQTVITKCEGWRVGSPSVRQTHPRDIGSLPPPLDPINRVTSLPSRVQGPEGRGAGPRCARAGADRQRWRPGVPVEPRLLPETPPSSAPGGLGLALPLDVSPRRTSGRRGRGDLEPRRSNAGSLPRREARLGGLATGRPRADRGRSPGRSPPAR